MAIATLERCYNNPAVFAGVVKIRKGEAVKMMMGVSNIEKVKAIMHHFASQVGPVPWSHVCLWGVCVCVCVCVCVGMGWGGVMCVSGRVLYGLGEATYASWEFMCASSWEVMYASGEVTYAS